jgi:hypothetical protein
LSILFLSLIIRRKEVDVLDYNRISWDNIKEHGSAILMIDVDNPGWVTEIQYELVSEREELFKVDKYITHQSNSYGPTGLVNIYEIVERSVDNKGNLILFVKNNAVSYNR